MVVTRTDHLQHLALPVEPSKLLALCSAALIKQDAVAGDREPRLIPAPVANFRDQDASFAAEFQTPPVERLCHQSVIMDK